MLVVYVDDFKMSGPAQHKARLWKDIIGDPEAPEAGGIYMGKPTAQLRFLGCDHELTEHTFVDKDGTSRTVRRMSYNMERYFMTCLDK